MTNTRFFLRLCLLAVFLAGCAPAASTVAPTPVVAVEPTATIPQPLPTLETSAQSTAMPVATSRGPDLQATDPTTVSLASGGLQLVEFFRFT